MTDQISDAIREAFEALDELAGIAGDHPGMPGGITGLVETVKAAMQSQTAPAVPDGWRVRKLHTLEGVVQGFRISTEAEGSAVVWLDDKTVNGRLLAAMLSAPQPDHSPDAGKVDANTCRAHGKFPCQTCGIAHFDECDCHFCRQAPDTEGWEVSYYMIPVRDQLPEMGVPVIGFHPDWIDADFNPRGLRECFRMGDGLEWANARWNDPCDRYETDEDAPSHWFHMVPNERPAESRVEIQAEAVLQAFKQLAAEYRPHGLNRKYTAFDVANHIEAQGRYYAARLRASQQEGGER